MNIFKLLPRPPSSTHCITDKDPVLLQDNDLSKFGESREIVQNLVDEYKAYESADYIKWGMEVFERPAFEH